MTTQEPMALYQRHEADEDVETFNKTVFGFWIYLMTDCVLFATLFATYAVLHDKTFGGPSSHELFDLPFALVETLILLTSSFSCGLGMLAIHRQRKIMAIILFGITFLLGLSFLGLELHEFTRFVQEGNSWQRSAFLSSYFTLVGTHGLHITFGLLWMLIMMIQIMPQNLSLVHIKRLTCMSLFWHFLDLIWIFIFTIVYLAGVLKI